MTAIPCSQQSCSNDADWDIYATKKDVYKQKDTITHYPRPALHACASHVSEILTLAAFAMKTESFVFQKIQKEDNGDRSTSS